VSVRHRIPAILLFRARTRPEAAVKHDDQRRRRRALRRHVDVVGAVEAADRDVLVRARRRCRGARAENQRGDGETASERPHSTALIGAGHPSRRACEALIFVIQSFHHLSFAKQS
jgi:hypothetical protein